MKPKERENLIAQNIAKHQEAIKDLNEDNSVGHTPELAKKMKRITKLSKELALVSSGFKCEGCDCRDDLEYHHRIERSKRQKLGFKGYHTTRHYYKNIMILCSKCHMDVHGFEDKHRLTIPLESIEEVKRKYGL